MVNDGEDDHATAKAKLSAALRAWNGLPDADQEREMVRSDVREIISRSDAEQAAEERAERALLASEVSRLRQQVEQLVKQAAPQPEPIVRSRLTPKQKSQIIRARGLAAYNSLPWA